MSEQSVDRDRGKDDPIGPEAHFNLGLAYLKQGYAAEAIRELDAAIDQPHDADAHFYLAVAYGQQGRFVIDVITEYDAALWIDPDYTEAHFNLGLVYEKQGRTDEAIRSIRRRCGSTPTMPKRTATWV